MKKEALGQPKKHQVLYHVFWFDVPVQNTTVVHELQPAEHVPYYSFEKFLVVERQQTIVGPCTHDVVVRDFTQMTQFKDDVTVGGHAAHGGGYFRRGRPTYDSNDIGVLCTRFPRRTLHLVVVPAIMAMRREERENNDERD